MIILMVLNLAFIASHSGHTVGSWPDLGNVRLLNKKLFGLFMLSGSLPNHNGSKFWESSLCMFINYMECPKHAAITLRSFKYFA